MNNINDIRKNWHTIVESFRNTGTINELEFKDEEAYNAYTDKHDVSPDTEVTVDGEKMKAGDVGGQQDRSTDKEKGQDLDFTSSAEKETGGESKTDVQGFKLDNLEYATSAQKAIIDLELLHNNSVYADDASAQDFADEMMNLHTADDVFDYMKNSGWSENDAKQFGKLFARTKSGDKNWVPPTASSGDVSSGDDGDNGDPEHYEHIEHVGDLFSHGMEVDPYIEDLINNQGIDPQELENDFKKWFNTSEWPQDEQEQVIDTIQRVASELDSDSDSDEDWYGDDDQFDINPDDYASTTRLGDSAEDYIAYDDDQEAYFIDSYDEDDSQVTVEPGDTVQFKNVDGQTVYGTVSDEASGRDDDVYRIDVDSIEESFTNPFENKLLKATVRQKKQ